MARRRSRLMLRQTRSQWSWMQMECPSQQAGLLFAICSHELSLHASQLHGHTLIQESDNLPKWFLHRQTIVLISHG